MNNMFTSLSTLACIVNFLMIIGFAIQCKYTDMLLDEEMDVVPH